MATVYGGNFDKGNKARMDTELSVSDTSYSITASGSLYSNVTWSNYSYAGTLSGSGTWAGSKGSWNNGKYATFTLVGNTTVFSGSKTHDVQSKTVSWSIRSNSGESSSCSYTWTIPAKTSYRVSYNANGGGSAPGAQTKWHGENLTLSASVPTRTGYTFGGWSVSAGGTKNYDAGETYTGNADLTLYAVWHIITYQVRFDANGGSSAPSAQTKTYGTDLTLSSAVPSIDRYNFKGWATAANGSAVYQAGGIYSNNASVTLYAVWELAYIPAAISALSASSVDSVCTMVAGSFRWAAASDGQNNLQETIRIYVKERSAESYPESASYQKISAASSGTVITSLTGFNTDKQYDIKIALTDTVSSTIRTTYVSTVSYTIDITEDGTGIAFGKAAEGAGCEFGMTANFSKPAAFNDTSQFNGSAGFSGDCEFDGSIKIKDVSGIVRALNDYLHPIGSIYISASSTNPALIWGGTWTQIKGRFLIATGDNDANTTDYWGKCPAGQFDCPPGERGGEAWHTLSINEMPAHGHKGRFKGSWQTASPSTGSKLNIFSREAYDWLGSNEQYTIIGDAPITNTGGGAAHNNMPPYLAVYMWQRTG